MGNRIFTNIMTVLAATLLCNKAIATQSPHVIDDFTAHYNIIHDDEIVGKAERTLKNLDDGTIEFSYKTDIEWFIFDDERRETTIVKLIDGSLIPISYKSTREGSGKNKHYYWQFDAEQKTVTNQRKKKPKPKAIDWPEGLQSKLSYHLQSRINLINHKQVFDFKVLSNSAKIKQYRYEYVGKEELLLPFGIVDAVKLKRQKVDSKKITYVWFAPSLNFLMVKLYQFESDFKQIHAELVSIEDLSPELNSANNLDN